MITSFYGTKGKPTRIFDEAGNSVPVTEIAVSPLTIVQVKTQEKEGYTALQVGFNWKIAKKNNPKKALSGHIKKTGQGTTHQPRFLREVLVIDVKKSDTEDYKLDDQIVISDVFQVGDMVKVTATSKSKGFQGGVKRHGFRGGSKTHGQSDRERAPGSIGQTTTPGRVYKGKRMAGRMGGETTTIEGLKIMNIDAEKHLVFVKGLIPGNTKSLVLIQKQ